MSYFHLLRNVIKSGKILTIIAVLFLVSCGSTLQIVKLDNNTGYFPTSLKVKPEEILVKEKVDLKKYKKFLYIYPTYTTDYNDFIEKSFFNMGYFDTIKNKKEMESFIIEKGLTSKINSISDYISLYNLHKEIGDFLIVEALITWVKGYNYKISLKIINPETAKPFLFIERTATNFNGLDKPLIYPTLNAVIDWINENK